MKRFNITEPAIHGRVGQRSFARGQRYYQQGAIFSPRKQDNLLKAKCWGSAPYPYQIWVQLGPDDVEAGECSCPIGDGGYCKHVAALLLTWLYEPDSFQEVDSIEKILGQKKKDDLIMLIRQMIARYPELEETIYLSPPKSVDDPTSINPDLIRRQVEQVVKYADYGHDYLGATQTIARELEAIMLQADIYRQREDWLNAAIITCTVLAEFFKQRDQIYDHNGDLGTVFWKGSERLGECLQQIKEPKMRIDILRTLVEIVLEDINVGGYGFADAAYTIVLEQSKAAEKKEISTWVEEALAKIGTIDDFSRKWQLEAYGRFLLNLQINTLTDEEYINLCRRTGQLDKLVEQLLKLGRVDDAIVDAQTASDYNLLALADIFVTYGHEVIAEGLIWERAGTSKDTRLDGWLKKHAIEKGDWQKAIHYTENQFWLHPNIDTYRDIKSMSEKLGNWPKQAEKILGRLKQQGAYLLLTRIHILEKEVEAALAIFPKVKFGGDLGVDIARAAEDTHPREAISLYKQSVERFIAMRGRDNYAKAAELLVRIKALHEQLQITDTWQQYIHEVRSQKPRLPALLDELKQAGLG